MNDAKNLRAGVIGLGMIGGGVAASLVHSGVIPAVYDVVPDAHKKHEGVPEPLASPAEVAAVSDVVMIAVFNYQQCKEVIAGAAGLLENAHENMTLVILSTIAIDELRDLCAICDQKGVALLDCGVTPGSRAANNGLVAMVGGSQEVFENAKPVLDAWSGAAFYCGPSGAGMACKIARNVNTYGVWRVTSEAFRLAVAAGIDRKTFLEVLETADKSENIFYQLVKVRAQTANGKLPPGMARVSEYMRKDLTASKALSDTLDVKMPVRDEILNYCKDTFDCEESE